MLMHLQRCSFLWSSLHVCMDVESWTLYKLRYACIVCIVYHHTVKYFQLAPSLPSWLLSPYFPGLFPVTNNFQLVANRHCDLYTCISWCFCPLHLEGVVSVRGERRGERTGRSHAVNRVGGKKREEERGRKGKEGGERRERREDEKGECVPISRPHALMRRNGLVTPALPVWQGNVI